MKPKPNYNKKFFVEVDLNRFEKIPKIDAETVYDVLREQGIKVTSVTEIRECIIYKGKWFGYGILSKTES